MASFHRSPRRRRRVCRLAALAAFVLVGSVAAFALQRFVSRNLHAVVPGEVYRSGQPTPAMLAEMQKTLGLRTVINLRGFWPDDDWHRQETQAAAELGLEHHDIDLRCYRLASLAQVRKLIELLDACPKPVLLHCRQGADRTSLAAAIYMIVYQGRSPAEAMSQYSVWYGHLGYADGWRLPHLFDCYRGWLAEQKATHSSAEFRRWAASETVVGYFGAAITPAANVQQAVPGHDALVFDVRNISQVPWVLDPDDPAALHLRVRITHPSGKRTYVEVPGPPGIIEPGQSVRIEAPVPAELTEAGHHVIFADLQDRHGIHFCDMGAGGSACLLELLPSAPMLEAGHSRTTLR
jgi:protein tyrosine phosphatase (PTP) superfamily phosphohydrolase (DUF442 family)